MNVLLGIAHAFILWGGATILISQWEIHVETLTFSKRQLYWEVTLLLAALLVLQGVFAS